MERLEKNVIHDICTNQVVVTLHACVKELVENALDAGATRIEVKLRESGSELLEVVDNGKGVALENYALLATRHATSKIREYEDLSNSLATFGFRGEALAGICAMGDMTVCTRTADDSMASLLVYDHYGKLTSTTPAAREAGTTVSARDLFKRLPVRHREFMRNAKAQVSTALRLIQAYAIANPEIRFHVIAEKSRGHGAGRATLLSTSGSSLGWIQAAASVLGDSVVADVNPLEMESAGGAWKVSGAISMPHGGRRTRDMQLFFVNNRPIDPPKRIVKLINDTYHQYNSRLYPVIILSFTAAQGLVDVNVTPDKRTVFLHNEESLLADLQQSLTELWAPSDRAASTTLASFGIRGAPVALPAAAAATEPAASLSFASFSASSGVLAPAPSLELPLASATQAESQANIPESGSSQQMHAEDSGGSAEGMLETPEKPTSAAASQPDFDLGQAPAKRQKTEPAAVLEPPTFSPVSGGTVGLPTVKTEPTPTPLHGDSASAGRSFTAAVLDLDMFGSGRPVVEVGSAPSAPSREVFASEDSADVAMRDGGDTADADACAAAAVGAAAAAMPTRCGSSVQVGVRMADLEAAVARRRAAAANAKLAQASAAAKAVQEEAARQRAAAVQFPSSFSLSSLNAGEGASASIDEVAKFNTGSDAAETAAFKFDKSCFTQMRVIGQFNLGFIIAALRTGGEQQAEADGLQLFIIDQHASDEKFRFEGLNRESKIDRQPLITPHPLQLTPAQEAIAEANLEVFRLNGFDVSADHTRPPGRRLRLASLPTCQGMVFGDKDIHDLIYTLEESEVEQGRPGQLATGARGGGLLDMTSHRALWSAGSIPRPSKVWQLLACRACRGAIMIGKALRVAEMERILRNLGGLQQPWNCPHGRPTLRHLVDASVARKSTHGSPPLAAILRASG